MARRSASPSAARVIQLTADDYYARSSEFKLWLSEHKRLYLDEISSSEARRYFDKFIRRWNEGRLSESYYNGGARAGTSAQTRHKWTFARTAREEQEMALVRDSVDTLTHSSTRGAVDARNAEKRSRRPPKDEAEDITKATGSNVGARDSGWNTGSAAGRQVTDLALAKAALKDQHQRARQDERDLEDRATGRERMLEKKRERNHANRTFASSRNEEDELDDRELFDDIPAQRSRQASRPSKRDERQAEWQDKVSRLRDKESKTIDMLKSMAQQRFPSS